MSRFTTGPRPASIAQGPGDMNARCRPTLCHRMHRPGNCLSLLCPTHSLARTLLLVGLAALFAMTAANVGASPSPHGDDPSHAAGAARQGDLLSARHPNGPRRSPRASAIRRPRYGLRSWRARTVAAPTDAEPRGRSRRLGHHMGGVDEAGTGVAHPGGRTHPPYTERLLVRAIGMGIDPGSACIRRCLASGCRTPTPRRWRATSKSSPASLRRASTDREIRIGNRCASRGDIRRDWPRGAAARSAYVDSLNEQGASTGGGFRGPDHRHVEEGIRHELPRCDPIPLLRRVHRRAIDHQQHSPRTSGPYPAAWMEPERQPSASRSRRRRHLYPQGTAHCVTTGDPLIGAPSPRRGRRSRSSWIWTWTSRWRRGSSASRSQSPTAPATTCRGTMATANFRDFWGARLLGIYQSTLGDLHVEGGRRVVRWRH